MSEIRKANVPDATYFVTLTVVGWVDVFSRKEYAEEIIASLIHCQQHKGLELFAYVIMPSHIHFVGRRNGGLMSDLLHDLKSYTAKRALELAQELPTESRREWMLHVFRYNARERAQNKEFAFWQQTSHPIELWTSAVLDQKIAYVIENPVVAGLVTRPEHYRWSSAHPESAILVLDV